MGVMTTKACAACGRESGLGVERETVSFERATGAECGREVVAACSLACLSRLDAKKRGVRFVPTPTIDAQTAEDRARALAERVVEENRAHRAHARRGIGAVMRRLAFV